MSAGACHIQSEPRDHRVTRVKSRLRLEFELSGLSQKAVAIDLGIDHALLSRWLSDHYKDLPGPHHVMLWTVHVGPGFLSWLAQQSGHSIILDAITFTPATMGDAGDLAAMAGQTVQILARQFGDGHWDDGEKRQALPGLRQLQEQVDRLVREAGTVRA